MNELLRMLTRTGARRGLGGSRGWMIAGVVAGGIRALQRFAHSEAEVLYRTEIKAGDRFEIKTRRPTKR